MTPYSSIEISIAELQYLILDDTSRRTGPGNLQTTKLTTQINDISNFLRSLPILFEPVPDPLAGHS
ncbi:MAG: hypothetical protein WBV72_14100 [Nitrososphaeraceae archaeon]